MAVVILFWGWSLLKDSVNILFEAAPKGITTDDLSKSLKDNFKEIEEIMDIRLWTITSNMHAMTAQIKLKEEVIRGLEREILPKIKQIANDTFSIEHTTIEFC